jgi:hypothetical protein
MASNSPSHLTKEEYRILRKAAHGELIPRGNIERNLRSVGYLELHVCGYTETYGEAIFDGSMITPEGKRHLAEVKIRRSERFWTRALSIIAIIISLCALLLELQDRGLLPGSTPAKTPAAQWPPARSESRPMTEQSITSHAS